jgi:hypothetical protein
MTGQLEKDTGTDLVFVKMDRRFPFNRRHFKVCRSCRRFSRGGASGQPDPSQGTFLGNFHSFLIHQAVSENADALGGGVAGELIEVDTTVPAAVENDLAICPALCDVVRDSGHHPTC